MTARAFAARRGSRSLVWSVGEVPLRPPLLIAAWGPPGGGKSTWCLRLASALVGLGQTVLIVLAEEGLAETVSERLRRLEVRDDSIYLTGPLSWPDTDAQAVEHGAGVVMLDSWSRSSWSVLDLDVARARYLFVLTLEATKGGEALGPNAIAHGSDVFLRIEGLRARIEKSRWGTTGETEIVT